MYTLITLPPDIYISLNKYLTLVDMWMLHLTHRRFKRISLVLLQKSKTWTEYVQYPRLLNYVARPKLFPSDMSIALIKNGDLQLYLSLYRFCIFNRSVKYTENCVAAISSGNLDMVRYIVYKYVDNAMGIIAINEHQLEIFKYLWNNGYVNKLDNNYVYLCLKIAELKILEWLMSQVKDVDTLLSDGRIFAYCNLDVLKFLHGYEITFKPSTVGSTTEMIYYANININAECIKYMIENDIPHLDGPILSNAIMNHREDIIKLYS